MTGKEIDLYRERVLTEDDDDDEAEPATTAPE